MIARAIVNEGREFASTKWSDALSSRGEAPSWGGARFGNRFVDSSEIAVNVSANVAFRPIRRIGGKTGWYYGDWLWQVRGLVDLLVGGVGVRRGRRDPEMLQVGDPLDFWRVEALEENRKLLLAAEMKLPGRAWLQFAIEDKGRPRSFVKPRSSIRSVLPAWYIGTFSIRFTSSSFRECFAPLLQRAMKKRTFPNERPRLHNQRPSCDRPAYRGTCVGRTMRRLLDAAGAARGCQSGVEYRHRGRQSARQTGGGILSTAAADASRQPAPLRVHAPRLEELAAHCANAKSASSWRVILSKACSDSARKFDPVS